MTQSMIEPRNISSGTKASLKGCKKGHSPVEKSGLLHLGITNMWQHKIT